MFLRISTHDLCPADVPDSDRDLYIHWHELALSFAGYERFSDCPARANRALSRWERGERPAGSLEELRGWLFFEQRRSHHLVETYDLDYIEFLVESIRVWVAAGETREAVPDHTASHPRHRPARADEAACRRWPLARYRVQERFGAELVSDGDGGKLALGARAGTFFLIRQPDLDFFTRQSYWEVMPFVSREDRDSYCELEIRMRSWRRR